MTVEEMFDQHYEEMVSKMKGRVPNVADAEDIVMTAFERAVKYYDRYDHSRSAGAWLNTLATNAWKDWLKADRLKGMTTEVNEQNGGEVSCTGQVDHMYQLLSGEIKRLRAGFKKDVLYRRFMMGLPFQLIAKTLDADKERVKKCILRHRQSMRDKYGVEIVE
tara:strand:+ start:11866 stop:12354 length:489 start_codon:yes stop_codon:yes gene_type:complete